MLALLGSVGYADQLFALDSSCARPRDAVKLNTCSVTVRVPATAGACLRAPAVRAYQVVGHTGVPELRSHEWLHLGASHGAGGDAWCPSESGRTLCHGGRACPRAWPAHVHQPGCVLLLTTLIPAIRLRRTELTAEGLVVVF